MQFRPIVDDGERESYRQLFREHSGVTLPAEYCAGAKIVGGFNRAGTLVGGFLVAPGSAMRWPTLLPSACPFQQRVPLERMVELNGLWLSPSERRGGEAAQLWACVGETIFATGASYVTYATDVRKHGLMKLYRRISSAQIYEGPFLSEAIPIGAVFYLRPWRIQVLRMIWATGLLQAVLFRKPQDAYGMPIRRWHPLGWLKERMKRRARPPV
ncbi:MAG: hypothetical protein ACJ8AT_12765 [Hyalangium sp.]|uniref:hypothetical protein n=1 Tax=Hyalangium sp. TaxID=2028555 RepID=UPI003899A3E1